MKKFMLLSLTLVLIVSCSLNDDNANYNSVYLPVESVVIPDTFALGEVYPIKVNYLKPSNCYSFRDFYYYKENNERTVAITNFVLDRNDCENLEEELTSATFNFKVTGNGSYIFKFWQGEDDNNEDQYLIIEVPVKD